MHFYYLMRNCILVRIELLRDKLLEFMYWD